MKPIRQYPLRKIAESVLARHFPDLGPALRVELTTSLVRQWQTCDGHAGIVTPTRQCWLQAVATARGLEVGFSEGEGKWGHALSREWHVDEGEIPDLLHRLNVCQTASWRTADGRSIRLRVEPKERRVTCREEAADEGIGDP